MIYYIECNTIKESKKCQEKLFELGYNWYSGDKEILELLVPILLILYEDKTMAWTKRTIETQIYNIKTCPLFKNKLELE